MFWTKETQTIVRRERSGKKRYLYSTHQHHIFLEVAYRYLNLPSAQLLKDVADWPYRVSDVSRDRDPESERTETSSKDRSVVAAAEYMHIIPCAASQIRMYSAPPPRLLGLVRYAQGTGCDFGERYQFNSVGGLKGPNGERDGVSCGRQKA